MRVVYAGFAIAQGFGPEGNAIRSYPRSSGFNIDGWRLRLCKKASVGGLKFCDSPPPNQAIMISKRFIALLDTMKDMP